ncbi:pseudouridine synthase [Fontibacter flavus]|uniref:Pseudouridine synthase n=1 Tax=Fontibacter flavus TaxID=654838 RepID=A0ABV6FWE1_9BACT
MRKDNNKRPDSKREGNSRPERGSGKFDSKRDFSKKKDFKESRNTEGGKPERSGEWKSKPSSGKTYGKPGFKKYDNAEGGRSEKTGAWKPKSDSGKTYPKKDFSKGSRSEESARPERLGDWKPKTAYNKYDKSDKGRPERSGDWKSKSDTGRSYPKKDFGRGSRTDEGVRPEKSGDWKPKTEYNKYDKSDKGRSERSGDWKSKSDSDRTYPKKDFSKGSRTDEGGKPSYDKAKWGPKSDTGKPEGGDYKKVYKGRGKDEKPIHEWVPASKVADESKYKKKFNKPFIRQADEERPDYNFEALEKNHGKKNVSDMLRLNKFISNSGICSRREADSLIQRGEVKVNGEVITELGYKVNKTDKVSYKGKLINPEKPVYLLLNKPKDFITTTDDPMERKTVMNLIAHACEERVFPVGRLDRNTTGLLLFTNDGDLAAKLSHPSNNIKKIYQVTLDKPITQGDEQAILEGLTLEDGPAQVDDMQVLSKDRTILGLEIHLGRNRIVRRIFAHLGYEVIALDRVMYAGLDKKDIPRGNYRFLTEKEVIRLKYF